jgi:hypothetical protein
MVENNVCANEVYQTYINKLTYSVGYSMGFSFVPDAVSDGLINYNLLSLKNQWLCKQLIAISMLYFIKKHFADFVNVVGLFQLTSLISHIMKKNGMDPTIAEFTGSSLRFYIRFHEQLKSPAGLCIIFLSVMAGRFAQLAEKYLNYLHQEILRPR